MLTAAEIEAMHPLVDVSEIECGVYTPKDGDVDPTLLTTCIMKLAKADGAVFRMNAEVEEVRRQPDGVFEVALGGASPEVTARANRIKAWRRVLASMRASMLASPTRAALHNSRSALRPR